METLQVLSLAIPISNHQYLEKLADNSQIPWKSLVVAFSIGQYALEQYLAARQYQTLKAKRLPNTLEGVVDQTTFEKASEYQRAKIQFDFFSGLYALVESVFILQYDVIFQLWEKAGYWQQSYFPRIMHGEVHILQELLLMCQVIHCLILLFCWPSNWTSIPINFVKTFYLEEAYGFNKQTYYIFFTDIIKQLLLSLGFGGIILAGCLKIVNIFGKSFFFFLWIFAVVVLVVGITIYPTFIQPLFNKLVRLEEGELRSKVEDLASELDFPLKELYVMDGSKRTSHSNAYFFGLPWRKQIVIYDTLINDSTVSEVTAVLAHELGHWSLAHTSKILLISQIQIFCTFTLFSIFITNNSFYQSFGFVSEKPIFVGFILFNDILQPVNCLLKFLMNIITRKFEFQAGMQQFYIEAYVKDAFALNLGYAKDLSKSLIGLHKNNLSTMIADPLYSAYHFSHPILTERLKALGWKDSKTVKPRKK